MLIEILPIDAKKRKKPDSFLTPPQFGQLAEVLEKSEHSTVDPSLPIEANETLVMCMTIGDLPELYLSLDVRQKKWTVGFAEGHKVSVVGYITLCY